ncbi:hypothetical protein OJAV_G00236640 [Oryzias javanicus]|uniref:Uncharacterized protein n=1 Tax=Oryzias javanicus TaxID=123683 RepID=A0A3S2MAY5_ORYJA|nr:hypothetical protein OJAV_G00236640 [Oryzias javanicus]
MRCGETQKQLGETERKFVQSTNIHFLTPLHSFTEGGVQSHTVFGRITGGLPYVASVAPVSYPPRLPARCRCLMHC